MLNGAAISWRSKRQTTVALSTAEAYFTSASAMVQEVMHLRKMLENLGFQQQEPTPVLADKETCIKWSWMARWAAASAPGTSTCDFTWHT